MRLMRELSDRLTRFMRELILALSPLGADPGPREEEDRALSDDEAALFDAMLGLPPI